MKRNFLYVFAIFVSCFCVALSCKQNSNVIKPKVIQATKEDNEKNLETAKNIIKQQDEDISNYIQKDSVNFYYKSGEGYYYSIQKQTRRPKPQKGDILNINLEVLSLSDKVLYPKDKKSFKMEKSSEITALHICSKILTEEGRGTFLVPSFLAWGTAGDGDKIKSNQPVILKIELLKIEKDI